MRDGSKDSGVRLVSAEQLVLGLDLGTAMGWAVLDGQGRRVRSGVWRMPHSTIHPGKRWHDLALQLDHLLWPQEIALLVYEDVHRHQVKGRANFRAAQVYGGILAEALHAAFRLSRLENPRHARFVPCAGVPLTTMKMRATGNGAASKAEMIEAARWRFDHDFEDDNEAEACWAAWCGLQGEGAAPGAGHIRGARNRALRG